MSETPETETQTQETETTPTTLTNEPPAAEMGEQGDTEAQAQRDVEAQTDAGHEAPPQLTADALTFPDGFEADEGLTGEFLEWANERGLGVEDANSLVALQAKAMEQASERASQFWLETQQQWQDQVRNDPQIGGERLEENLGHIAKLIDHYGSDELRQAFDLTGAGNHPEVVKFLTAVARDFAEGSPTAGSPAGSGEGQADLSALYPTMAKQG